MTFNLKWVIKEKTDFSLTDDSGNICPYFRKTSNPASPSLALQCLAWTGFCSRFIGAGDIQQYCKKDFSACPLYKMAAGGAILEYQGDNAEAWPVFSP